MRPSKEQILSRTACGVLRISPAGGKVKTSPFQPAGLFTSLARFLPIDREKRGVCIP